MCIDKGAFVGEQTGACVHHATGQPSEVASAHQLIVRIGKVQIDQVMFKFAWGYGGIG